MAHGNEYQNSVITTATEMLEEELGQENVDVGSQKIQDAYTHLRSNLMALELHDISEEQGGTVEDRVRNITRKGREYLECVARANAEKPSDDWKRLFATAIGIPQDVPELELMDALVEKLSEIRQDSVDLRDELEHAVETLIEHLELPLMQAFGVSEERVAETSKEVLENLALLKQRLHEAEGKAEQTIDEAASKLPTDADRQEALAFASFL